MLQAILFDLDGTLLPIDTEEFLSRYLELLSGKMENFLDSKTFVKELMAATSAMINNKNSSKNNADIFIENFFTSTGLDEKEVMPVFEQFYLNEYRQLGQYYEPIPLVNEIVTLAKSKGYLLVLATNPLFPLLAIKERIRWAGINNEIFSFITCYEKMHASKPNPRYYQEITDIINISPDKCLMVGNDVEEDLVAKEIGMQTFLVHDYIINRRNIPITADYQGTLQDLFHFINSLKKRICFR